VNVFHVVTPPTVGPQGDGVSFSGDFFLSFFVSLSATLRENGWTYLHEIFSLPGRCGRPDATFGQFG